MKVIIIYPKISYEIFSEYYYIPRLFSLRSSKTQTSPLLMMPAALPTLAALTPPDIDIELVDENIEDVDFDVDVDIVGISSFSIMANRAYEIADKFRARGVYVVVGGIHASVAPDEVLEHADTVVIGEAEDIWPQFLEDYKNNSAKKKYVCEKKPDMLNPVVPRWDKLKHKHYLSHLIQTARGCPFDC
ncbi:MAG: B12-binding domain-containing radical SAM protein, partial [bacterium]|nr:B12-binding domain-containing radical SAM protein [bacterium]